MIETEQTIAISAPIGSVWNHVQDIRAWARLMPGYRDCTIVDAHESRWTLKVGVGGMVRTVQVLVHVDRWDGPGRVDFSFSLEGDPVAGTGTYCASSLGPGRTEVRLKVEVAGRGPMAPMWEAMGKPILPRLAKAFADQLKAEIEKAGDAPALHAVPTAAQSWLRTIAGRLFDYFRAAFGPVPQRPI